MAIGTGGQRVMRPFTKKGKGCGRGHLSGESFISETDFLRHVGRGGCVDIVEDNPDVGVLDVTKKKSQKDRKNQQASADKGVLQQQSRSAVFLKKQQSAIQKDVPDVTREDRKMHRTHGQQQCYSDSSTQDYLAVANHRRSSAHATSACSELESLFYLNSRQEKCDVKVQSSEISIKKKCSALSPARKSCEAVPLLEFMGKLSQGVLEDPVVAVLKGNPVSLPQVQGAKVIKSAARDMGASAPAAIHGQLRRSKQGPVCALSVKKTQQQTREDQDAAIFSLRPASRIHKNQNRSPLVPFFADMAGVPASSLSKVVPLSPAYSGPQFENAPSAKSLPFPVLSLINLSNTSRLPYA